jgi:predicted lipoprotein with Yx(FWY)xxD motif
MWNLPQFSRPAHGASGGSSWLGLLGAAAGTLAVAALVAGCGSTAPASHTSSSGSSGLVVRTASVLVNGRSESVLTNSAGRTLYYNTQDSASKVTCTGGCASIWPALTSGAGSVSAPSSVGGNFTFYSGPNGRQVEYNGHPLYTYSGDTGPHQSKGEGVGGIWYVATPGLTAASGSSSSSGGYAY